MPQFQYSRSSPLEALASGLKEGREFKQNKEAREQGMALDQSRFDFSQKQHADQQAAQADQVEREAKRRLEDLSIKGISLDPTGKVSLNSGGEADLARQKALADIAYQKAQAGKVSAEVAASRNPASKEYKKEQYDAAGYANRTRQAEDVFSDLVKRGYDRSGKAEGLKSLLPGMLQGDNMRSQNQAEDNFLNAVLRRESGASISPTERESGENQYFPRVGDSPEVLAQKAANRQQVSEALRAGAGGALDQVKYVSPLSGDSGQLSFEEFKKRRAEGKL